MTVQYPLNAADCLLDSPYYRDNLRRHEQQIAYSRKSAAILAEQCRNIIACTKALSEAYKTFAASLYRFGLFNSGQSSPANDEIAEIAKLIIRVEGERENMTNRIEETFIQPVNIAFSAFDFQREKKQVDAASANFQTVVDSHLSGSDQKPIQSEQHALIENMLNYVNQVQSFETLKRCEFLDALVCLVNHQMNFHHLSYEMVHNCRSYSQITNRLHELQSQVLSSVAEAESKKELILANPVEYLRTSLHKSTVLAGNLFVMKKVLLGNSWARCFLEYQKDTQQLLITPAAHFAHRFESGDRKGYVSFIVKECFPCDPGQECDNREFSFKVKLESTNGSLDPPRECTAVFQAQDDGERRLWIDAMRNGNGQVNKEKVADSADGKVLSERGFQFMTVCFEAIEKYNLDTVGLYRVPGAKPKIAELIHRGLSDDSMEKIVEFLKTICSDEGDVKVVTSAVQAYFNNVGEPLTTYDLHDGFLYAASLDDDIRCVRSLHFLVHRLPQDRFKFLNILFGHLSKIAVNSDLNKMTAPNLGICFGPTLFRHRQNSCTVEQVKLCNRAVVVLIEHHAKLFGTNPPVADIDAICEMWHAYDNKKRRQSKKASLSIQNSIFNGPPRRSIYLIPQVIGSVLAHVSQKMAPRRQPTIDIDDDDRSTSTAVASETLASSEADLTTAAATTTTDEPNREERKERLTTLTSDRGGFPLLSKTGIRGRFSGFSNRSTEFFKKATSFT